MQRSVSLVAPAKVNLFLGVGEALPDGYHRLETVFHALELHDVVTVEEAPALAVTTEPVLDVHPHDNLAYRAALAMGRVMGEEPCFAVHLEKHVPHGAGLAGGSSDAAATIAGIAHLRGMEPTSPACLSAAASVGADVPFALVGGAALMTRRGDLLERSLPAMSTPVLLVKPAAGVPTAAAYRAFDADPVPPGDPAAVIAALEAGDPRTLAQALSNSFEAVARTIVPEVGDILDWLRVEQGVLGAQVAGSGSAVFALLDDSERACGLVGVAQDRGWWSYATALAPHGAMVIDREGA